MTKTINDAKDQIEKILKDIERNGFCGGTFTIEHNNNEYEINIEKVEE